MAFSVSNWRVPVLALCCSATGLVAGTPVARAQQWSWFARGPAVAPASLAPAAIPVRTVKRQKKSVAQQVLRETTAVDVRRTLDVTRDFSALAQRLSLEAALQLDPTLRRGDIAVTSTGLHVFHGPEGSFHAARDFQPLAASRLAKRPDLRAIQTAGRYPAPSAATRAAFIDVLTVRPSRKIVEVRSRETSRQGFHVIDVPRMR